MTYVNILAVSHRLVCFSIMGRPKLYQREKLLETALYVFWEKGYAKTSIGDIATATGVDKKCLFREFTNKEKLFEEVLQLYSNVDIESFDSLLAQKPLGLENITHFFRSLKLGNQIKGCLLNKSIAQRNLIAESHFTIVKSTMIHLERLLQQNLQAAKENHQLLSTRTPEELAKYLLYTAQGIWTMSNYEDDPDHLEMVIESILATL